MHSIITKAVKLERILIVTKNSNDLNVPLDTLRAKIYRQFGVQCFITASEDGVMGLYLDLDKNCPHCDRIRREIYYYVEGYLSRMWDTR